MRISYAQNFEDVMLYRALQDQSPGFYIDVGAHDPTEFSVTRFFYDRGWRGINVEPVDQYHAALVRERPQDTNLHAAAGAAPGTQSMYVVPDTGLSTFVKDHADAAAERGFAVTQNLIPVLTLDEICRRLGVQTVHFLKIDVEGAEGDVLRGISFTDVRPWIVVVEATRPGTQVLAFDDWEPLLLTRDYDFVYFDGLNRFYVANEHAALKVAFAAPPNVFDGFVTARQNALEIDRHGLEVQVNAIREEADGLQGEIARIDAWTGAWPDTGDAVVATPSDDRVEKLKQRFAGLLALARQMTAERTALDVAMRTAQSEAFEQRRAADAIHLQLENAVAERDALFKAHETRVAEVTALTADRVATAEMLRSAKADAEHQGQRADALEERLDASVTAFGNRDAECVKLSALHEALGVAYDALEKRYTASVEQGFERAAQAQHFEQESSRLQEALAATQSAIQALEQDVQSARSLIESHAVARDQADASLTVAQTEAHRVDLELQAARNHIAGLEHRHQVTVAALDAFHHSRSWRLTAPFRAAMRWITSRQ